jgi:hypothetical protein
MMSDRNSLSGGFDAVDPGRCCGPGWQPHQDHRASAKLRTDTHCAAMELYQ